MSTPGGASPHPVPASRDHPLPASGERGVEGQQITYTCPMDPEVVRDAPGFCPICGMALEPRTATLESGPNPEYVGMRRRFVVSAILTAPILIGGMME